MLQAEPSRTKKNQGKRGLDFFGFSWIRFGAFQWVTADPKEKIFDSRATRRPLIDYAGPTRAELARQFPMPTSLSPQRRFHHSEIECHGAQKMSRTKRAHRRGID
jgi:hypothetical protein